MADVRGLARSAGREQGVETFYQRESQRNIRGLAIVTALARLLLGAATESGTIGQIHDKSC